MSEAGTPEVEKGSRFLFFGKSNNTRSSAKMYSTQNIPADTGKRISGLNKLEKFSSALGGNTSSKDNDTQQTVAKNLKKDILK